jgi:hypothetical protein
MPPRKKKCLNPCGSNCYIIDLSKVLILERKKIWKAKAEADCVKTKVIVANKYCKNKVLALSVTGTNLKL